MSCAAAATVLPLYCSQYRFLNFCLYFYCLYYIPVWKREKKRKIFFFTYFQIYSILRVQKHIFVGKKVLEIATLTAACIFNESSAPHTYLYFEVSTLTWKMRIRMSTLNFLQRRAREHATFIRLAGTYCATFMRLAGTYYNAFDKAGTRQWISSALNCIQIFFRADYDEASYVLFFTGFWLAGGILQPLSSGRHSNSY